MAGKRTKVTPEVEAYVRLRRQQGLSHRAIQAELAAKGTTLSIGAVHKIAPATAMPGVASDGRLILNPNAKPDSSAVPSPAADVSLEGAAVPEDADLATLEALEKEWQTMAMQAKEVGNMSGFIALQRLLRDAVVQKRKLRAPPAEKPEDNIDYVRAGEAAAETLHKLIDEALRAAGTDDMQ